MLQADPIGALTHINAAHLLRHTVNEIQRALAQVEYRSWWQMQIWCRGWRRLAGARRAGKRTSHWL